MTAAKCERKLAEPQHTLRLRSPQLVTARIVAKPDSSF